MCEEKSMTLKLTEDLVAAVEGGQTYDRTATQVAPEVRAVLRKVMAEDFDSEMEVALQELVVADYLVFLLALDTYMRYLTERFGSVDVTDPIVKQGVSLLRVAERMHLDAVKTFIGSNLTSPASIRLLEAAIRPPPTAAGAARRALLLRTVLSRGGTTTTRAVFGSSNKARREVQDAIEASMMEDEDAALNKFSAIILRNKRLEKWIDKASEAAQPDSTTLNSVSVATKGSSDAVQEILKDRVNAEGESPSAQESSDSSERQADRLLRVEDEAREAASKVLNRSGEEDRPLTKSEVVGVATAVATAIATDPDLPRNIPPTLQGLDPEQMAAAMSNGKVLVAAGAGSGKTSTLTARIAYLVKDQNVDPSRIMAICFNKKAAREIGERISQRIGDEPLSQMSVGTMHSMFRKFIIDYGDPEEKGAMTTWMMRSGGKGDAGLPSKGPSPAAMAGYMTRIWKECYPNKDVPRKTSNVIQKWMMNNITPEMARQRGGDPDVVEWYEWTLGFKGNNKGWKPPCNTQKSSKAWGEYLAKWRDNGRARLGGFEDMILMTRDILKRNPAARKKIQSMYDHVNVDEAQDLNSAQHEIVEFLTEHIKTDDEKKSVFMIGDEIQSISAFAGARPDLFTGIANKGFKLRSIATNYRCMPEIIELANNLMKDHPKGLPMAARPDVRKPRGAASIVYDKPESHASGAISTVTQIAQDVEAGAPLSDYAVLTRTNAEINDFETACIIQGVPYARRGSTSFLRSPETITVMSYFNLAVGQDFERMQRSLVEVLNKPNRFFLRAGEAERIVEQAISLRARKLGVGSKAVNPLDLFTADGLRDLVDAMDPDRRWENWKVRATREQLEEMGYALRGMRDSVEAGNTVDRDGKSKPYTTQDLLGDILNIKGVPESRDKPAPSLRDVLMPAGFGQEEEADDPDQDEKEKNKPIGNVQFLYQISQATGGESDPSNPRNFKSRIDKLVADSKDLRVDLDVWDREQQKLAPNERKGAPAVVLSTVHSVKGAQWSNVTVVMADGVFPHKATLEGSHVSEDETDPGEKEKRLDFLTERQLAYVAFTRAAKNLTVMSPSINAYGKQAKGDPLFVKEAGLHVGQNVEGKNDPRPEAVETVKTVFAWSKSSSSEHGDMPEPEVEPKDKEASSESNFESYSFDRRSKS
jgi:superfamily I DNA/RNA helicase